MTPVQSPAVQSPLVRLIYYSRPFGFDDLALTGILAAAERNNPPNGITGALICREDIFIQMLEGPEAFVQGAFDRIRSDDRHTDVVLVSKHPAAERLFPDWAMRHDPAQSWLWSHDEVTAGAAANATPGDYLAIFTRLATAPQTNALSCPISSTTA
jgi:hypothetical protein